MPKLTFCTCSSSERTEYSDPTSFVLSSRQLKVTGRPSLPLLVDRSTEVARGFQNFMLTFLDLTTREASHLIACLQASFAGLIVMSCIPIACAGSLSSMRALHASQCCSLREVRDQLSKLS